LALVLGPAWLALAAWLFAAYPWRPVAEHLVVVLLLGLLLVELCLFSFQKIPFTCSYLPGKAKLHFVFWAGLMFFVFLLAQTAIFEGRMLEHVRSWLAMILVLLAGVVGMRWVNEARSRPEDELMFEEEEEAEITSLKLS
jgi:hypothetical protein